MKIKPTNNLYLSVVIPVFNEEKRIDNLLKIDKVLLKLSQPTEIIVVNDGSNDKTLKLLKRFNVNTPLRIISYKVNKGKGYAVKKGMLAAHGKYRLFMDIDLSTKPEQIMKFLKKIEKGYDVVIGSRKIKGARVTNRQSILRENLGKTFTALSKVVLEVPISDFTCGFKMFRDSASYKIFRLQKLNRWGFDSEILFLAVRKKLRLIEVPIEWENKPYSKVKFPQDLIGSFIELLQIRINYYKGRYNQFEKTSVSNGVS